MKQTYKRPEDIKYFRTNDPKKLLGKYIPHPVYKQWTEDFADSDTGEIVSIERRERLFDPGKIDKDNLQNIMVAIQAGDIEEIEVCDTDIRDIELDATPYHTAYVVQLRCYIDQTETYICYATSIPQAIRICAEFGHMYRGFSGSIKAKSVTELNANIIPDDHLCIPEADRKPAKERKDYYRVTVHCEYLDDSRYKTYKTEFIIAANDVGEAKERIARFLDIKRAGAEKEGDKMYLSVHRKIQKAMPFAVDCVVPDEYSKLYVKSDK